MNDPADWPDLSEVQAIILKPHGRNLVNCVFFRFDRQDPVAGRQWMAALAQSQITSADEQNRQTEAFRMAGKKIDGEIITCCYLSHLGYKMLRIPQDLIPDDLIFEGRMHRAPISVLNDPPLKELQADFQRAVDGMILLAGNNRSDLETRTRELVLSFRNTGAGAECFLEEGKRLFHRFGDRQLAVEPFGFRDGLSQPRFFHKDRPDEPVPDSCKIVLDQNHGSYLVFRKLEQDVAKFNRKIGELATALNISRAMAEAQVVGRFKDGTPLTLFDDPTSVETREDRGKIAQFDDYALHDPQAIGYEEDPHGSKCPFHAHIRQVNPRNGLLLSDADYDQPGQSDPEEEEVVLTRIVRRGIPYDHPGGKVGLLFMSFQRTIKPQFIRMQGKWANNPKFRPVLDGTKHPPKPGLDPLIGQRVPDAHAAAIYPPQQWNSAWGETRRGAFAFSDVVTYRGGEYFYAPCLSFLRGIDKLGWDQN